MMSTDICVEKIMANMLLKNPSMGTALDNATRDAMKESYEIIVDAILEEVKKATVTLNFATGAAGAPVAGVLSASPGAPVTGVGVFSPIDAVTGVGGALS
jgi:hypothetical protein